MNDDGRLLRQYREQGLEAAFARLAARHLDFVYATCLRETGDAALAEDAAQVVFLLLARKAPLLRPGQSLSGWLFQTARFAARNARRREARRRAWEQRAVEQTPSPDWAEDALWDRLGPAVNDALASLGARDREAVLLRFADGLSFPELGAALGTSEDAARMRLNRALDRLRRFFAKHGVTLSAAVLVGLLADRVAQAAPTTCAASVAKITEGAALGGGTNAISAQVHSQLQGALKAMTISKIKLVATIVLGIALAGSLPFVTRAQNHKVSTAPQAVLPNPHSIPSDTATPIGSLSAPAVQGWTKEFGHYSYADVVYYRTTVGGSSLTAKVLYMPRPKGMPVQDLGQQKVEIDKNMRSILSPGEKRTILVSKIVQYQQQPAILHVREERYGGKVERIKALMFNRDDAQYQFYLYVHPLSPDALKVGEQFWQRLTGGLHE